MNILSISHAKHHYKLQTTQNQQHAELLKKVLHTIHQGNARNQCPAHHPRERKRTRARAHAILTRTVIG
jgi:hypothetical protein